MNALMQVGIFLLIFFAAGILLRVNIAFSLGFASLGLIFFQVRMF